MSLGNQSANFFSGCADLASALYDGMLAILLMAMFGVSLGTGGAAPYSVTHFQVGPAPGPGGGPGGAATATPRPSPTATPVPTPRVTPVPTPSPTPLATPTPTPVGGGGGIPPISTRTIHGGQVHATVSGFFGVDTTVAINTGVTSAGEFDTWLFYGTGGTQGTSIGIFLGDPQYVQVTSGTVTVQSKEDECTMQVQVTASSISGHVSCTGVTAYDLPAGTNGLVTIELDFTADS